PSAPRPPLPSCPSPAPRRLPRCFFFPGTATTEFYTLSLHDALPISVIVHNLLQSIRLLGDGCRNFQQHCVAGMEPDAARMAEHRSEEHTSELQSRENLVCRLLLEKKKHTQHDATDRQHAPPHSHDAR